MTTADPKHTSEGSSGEGEASSGEEYPEQQKKGVVGKLQRNCHKWWWLYLLILIIVVVLIVIPIIFVGIKKSVRSRLNDTTINVTSQLQTNPLPDSFDLTINSTSVNNQATHGANIEGFNASLYLLDTQPDIQPFLYLDFPPVSASPVNPVNIAVMSQPIANMTQLIAYNTLVLTSEEFTIGIRGHTGVKIDQLPKYSLLYNNTITMKGWNGLAGFNIHNLFIPFVPDFDGATMIGQVSINNPSVISAQLGNVTMDLAAQDGTSLGYILLEYVDFQPGDNNIGMRGYVDVGLVQQYAEDQVVDLQITGNSSVNIIGQHLPYYEGALRAYTFNYRLNLTEAQEGGTTT